MCSVNFWHQQDSNSLFKGSIGHVTSQSKWPIFKRTNFIHRLCSHYGGYGFLRRHENHVGQSFCSHTTTAVTEGSCAAPTSKAESHLSETCSHYSRQLFVAPRKEVQYSMNITTVYLYNTITRQIRKIRCSRQDKVKVMKATERDDLTLQKLICRVIAGLPRARSARGTEPHTHGIWSTSFRLVVT